jgi:hypothetical protein
MRLDIQDLFSRIRRQINMQSMQSFYDNLVQSGSENSQIESTSIGSFSQAAIDNSLYKQYLVRLTKTNLAQLNALKSLLGWVAWWTG